MDIRFTFLVKLGVGVQVSASARSQIRLPGESTVHAYVAQVHRPENHRVEETPLKCRHSTLGRHFSGTGKSLRAPSLASLCCTGQRCTSLERRACACRVYSSMSFSQSTALGCPTAKFI